MIRGTPTGVEIDVRIIPRARRSEVGVTRDDAFVVRIASPPVDGAANAALMRFLADTLGVPVKAVRILSGDRGRRKRIAIAGVTVDDAKGVLTRAAR